MEPLDVQRRRDRRQRRRRERRQFFSVTSVFALAFAISLGVALYISWIIYPLSPPTASPAVFHPEVKADYLYMVSQNYAATGDWETAQERLNELQDPNLNQTVVNLLEEYLRTGQPADAVRNLAGMAAQLGVEDDTLLLFAPSDSDSIGGVVEIIPTPTATLQSATATPTLLPTPTEIIAATGTAVPAVGSTGTPTPEPNYRLLSQRQVCQSDLDAPRIEVTVVDQLLDELAGTIVRVKWRSGEDEFITGFKPDEGPGYADFTMTSGIAYSVEMVDGSAATSGLQVEPCTDGDGLAGWQLRFQKLRE